MSTPQGRDVIGVQGFDLALSQARQRQGGGVVKRFWAVFGTATAPSRRERWPDLHSFVTGDDGLAMSADEFADLTSGPTPRWPCPGWVPQTPDTGSVGPR